MDCVKYAQAMKSTLGETIMLEMSRELYLKIERYAPWEHREVEGQIATVADYATGTVAITQGATTATFTGSTLIAAMITRHFQVEDDNRWYQFRSINTGAGTAELMDPYEGTTVTTASFTIRQRYYRLPPDFDKSVVAKETQGMQVVYWETRAMFERYWSQIEASGQIQSIVPAGVTTVDLYNTGTAAVSNAGTTVTITTGVVNSIRDKYRRFRMPMFPKCGDFTIIDVSEGGNTYTIDRAWPDKTVTGQLFKVDPIGERLVEFFPAPTEGYSSVRFFYHRIPPPLFLDTDTPKGWDTALFDVWKEALVLRCATNDPDVFRVKFNTLMESFMGMNGMETDKIVGPAVFGRGGVTGSNLPWNFAPFTFWGRR